MGDVGVPLLLSFLAGISTAVGSFVFLFVKEFKKSYLSFFLGLSAGTMIYLSFLELIPEAIESVGFAEANIAFFAGIALVGIIDMIAPHHFSNYCLKKGIEKDKLMLTGFMVALGITLHNFPEGIAVFMSSWGDVKLGSLIAFATALHNIPEGVAVAVPIYYSSKSKKKAFNYSLLAGMAEPVGAFLAYLIIGRYLSSNLLAYIFAIVAGIMVYISFDELLPTCFENGQGHTAIVGIVSGMLLMAGSLAFI